MTTRHIVSLTAVAGAIAAASPAFAQEMTYGENYEYAQPAPAAPQPVIYTQQPVVQPIPAPRQPANYVKTAHGADYAVEEYEVEYETVPHGPPTRDGNPGHQAHHRGNQHYNGHHQAGYPQPPAFDRVAWLEECEDRYADANDGGSTDVLGGVIGAAAGGLLGNRVAGRGDRLAGTLIGAGVGGLAGLAVGSAIGAAGKNRKRSDAQAYCENWLARYAAGGYQHHGYYGYGYYPAYYQQLYILVPQTVRVPQRAVIREYVTEEYVDVPVTTYETIPGKRHLKRVPVKPIKRKAAKRYRKIKGQ